MALFKFGKKKEENKASACCCGEKSVTVAPKKVENHCCGTTVEGICYIKVLGAGCASCHKLFENVKEAAESLDLSLEVEYITNMEKIMEYGVMKMPALVVNDKVVSMGKVLKKTEIEELLKGL